MAAKDVAALERVGEVAPAVGPPALVPRQRAGQGRIDALARDRRMRDVPDRLQRLDSPVRRPPVGGEAGHPSGRVEGAEDAGHRQPLRLLPARQAAVLGRPGPDRGVDHVRKPDVAGEQRRAVDLGRKVEARQRLAGEAVVDAGADREMPGQLLARRGLDQLGEAEPACPVENEARRGVQGLPLDPPARSGRLHQEGSGARSRLAQRPLERPHRARSRGQHRHVGAVEALRPPAPDAAQEGAVVLSPAEQPVGVERSDRRGLHPHRPPVRPELVGEDLGERRPASLTQLRLRYGDQDLAVLADLDEGVERLLALAGAEIMLIGARPQSPGQDQPGPGAPADEQGPPADAPRLAAARHDGLIEGRGGTG
jgi:hypothetical protein